MNNGELVVAVARLPLKAEIKELKEIIEAKNIHIRILQKQEKVLIECKQYFEMCDPNCIPKELLAKIKKVIING